MGEAGVWEQPYSEVLLVAGGKRGNQENTEESGKVKRSGMESRSQGVKESEPNGLFQLLVD